MDKAVNKLVTTVNRQSIIYLRMVVLVLLIKEKQILNPRKSLTTIITILLDVLTMMLMEKMTLIGCP